MTETNVFQLSQPGTFADPLTEVLRNGARALLAQAIEAEVAALLASHTEKRTEDGRQRLVRHGHLPEREIMTGIGPVAVRCPRVRDRLGEGAERIRFSSMPAGCRRRPSDGSRRPGRRSMHAGASVISRPNATSTSGSTASTCRRGLRTRPSACWSSSGRPPRARRSWSA